MIFRPKKDNGWGVNFKNVLFIMNITPLECAVGSQQARWRMAIYNSWVRCQKREMVHEGEAKAG